MAVVVLLEWPGVTREQYEAVLEALELGERTASGGVFQVAGSAERAWRVVDVWESQEAFDKFMHQVLGAVLEQHRLPPPQIQMWPAHRTVTP